MIAATWPFPASRAAMTYGVAFENNYRAAGLPRHAGELAHFRAMSQSLIAASTADVRVASHEYHGANHQVLFQGDGVYSRTSARCELSDLAVLTYDPRKHVGRLTYIQAKYERSSGRSCKFPPSSLEANPEQWDLLGRRPQLTKGVGRFSPPLDLLSAASLHSIGTFIFFIEYECGHVELAYSVAKDLTPTGSVPNVPKRRGRVTSPRQVYVAGSTPELRSAWGAHVIAAGLADLCIGTPILTDVTKKSGLDAWLAAEVASASRHPAASREFIDLADELRDQLGDASGGGDDTESGGVGALQLIVLRTTSDREERG